MLLAGQLCTGLCTDDFRKSFGYHALMKADLRISIKDIHRHKTLKILLARTPYGTRQFLVRMNGQRWPADGQPVSLTRVLTALRKALVKAT